MSEEGKLSVMTVSVVKQDVTVDSISGFLHHVTVSPYAKVCVKFPASIFRVELSTAESVQIM
jgi:hypothetical protein